MFPAGNDDVAFGDPGSISGVYHKDIELISEGEMMYEAFFSIC